MTKVKTCVTCGKSFVGAAASKYCPHCKGAKSDTPVEVLVESVLDAIEEDAVDDPEPEKQEEPDNNAREVPLPDEIKEIERKIDDLETQMGLKPLPTRESILADAKRCVCGEREHDYGSLEDNFSLISRLWTSYLGNDCEISAKDVAMMMALLKIARARTGSNMDSFVDLAGYAACAGEIVAKGATK